MNRPRSPGGGRRTDDSREEGYQNYNSSRYSPSFGPRPDGARSWDSRPPRRTASEPAAAKADYSISGKLSAEKLEKDGVRLKYDEPSDGTTPAVGWRIHVFKGEAQMAAQELDEKGCYRFGRDRLVNDIVLEHESCSKQHAVLQYRLIHLDQGFGQYGSEKRLYLIDLDSTHGTWLNGRKIEGGRFIQLKPLDIIKFAFSSREYVVLNEKELLQPQVAAKEVPDKPVRTR